MAEKIKIKLSEVEELYDIEDDTPKEKKALIPKTDYDIMIEEEDQKLEEEFDYESQ